MNQSTSFTIITAELWNAMVPSLLLEMFFHAALWCQGETNADDPASYAFPAMIADWQ